MSSYDEHNEAIDEMAAKILTPELAATLKKKLQDELAPIWEAVVDEVIEGAGQSVSRVAADRAKKFLEAVLAGDPAASGNLFGLNNFTGRPKSGENPVIHGSLFEAEPVALRRKLVEANADLLRDGRMADLEATVEAMRQQIQRLQQQLDRNRSQSWGEA